MAAEKGGRRLSRTGRVAGEATTRPLAPPPDADASPVDGVNRPAPDPFHDAPPSYEDAMADALAPLDGPRRAYHPPTPSELAVADRKTPVRIDTKLPTSPPPRSSVLPRRGNDSNESIDLLPTTPGSRASSLPDSVDDELEDPEHPAVAELDSLHHQKHAATMPPEPPHASLPPSSTSSGSSSPRVQRSFSMGIPTRKPVPAKPAPTEPSKS
jgi:hypothetical protein